LPPRSAAYLDPALLTELTTVDKEKWRQELSQIEAHYETFGERLPGVLHDQLKDLEKRLAEN
jgi:phosphoenolpyruvate carboxykinase (GTP)